MLINTKNNCKITLKNNKKKTFMSKNSPMRISRNMMLINHLKNLNAIGRDNRINNSIVKRKIFNKKTKKVKNIVIVIFAKFCIVLRDLINRITNKLNKLYIIVTLIQRWRAESILLLHYKLFWLRLLFISNIL